MTEKKSELGTIKSQAPRPTAAQTVSGGEETIAVATATTRIHAVRSVANPPAIPNHVSLEDVVISGELLLRRVRKVKARAEIAGMHTLANLLPGNSSMILKRLAELAVELCEAGSGGISMLETGEDGEMIFRWRALAGELERYEGGATPRHWSPCGECLKAGKPMLYSYPARFFTYFQDVSTTIVEGLVIPMYSDGLPVGTIWIVAHDEQRNFDAEDVRLMTSLSSFATAALRISMHKKAGLTRDVGPGREVVWREFVRRMAHGDASALEALFDETQPLVFGKALRVLGFSADAEEITADVFSQVWRIAPRYDPGRGGVLAWMLNITRSRALDRLRSRTYHELPLEAALYVECSSLMDPDTSLACSNRTRHIRQALQTLPFEQCRVIELAYFQGYSMVEIAARLGHPLGTVKSRIRAGLTGLRRIMGSCRTNHPALFH